MREPLPGSSPSPDLVAIIGQARRRWRLKVALRAITLVLAGAVVLLAAAAAALEAARFSPAWILAMRILVPTALAALAGYVGMRPLLRRVSDAQVALYLEEHEPSLQAEIISAVEASRTDDARGSARSGMLAGRLVASAVEKCVALDAARQAERVPLRRLAGTIGATALVAAALFLLGPAYLRHGVAALLLVARSADAAVPYRIHVAPGHAAIPRGADQPVDARLEGFEAGEAALMMRRTAAPRFETLPLVRDDRGVYHGMLLDVADATEYFVEAGGVRSPVFTIQVVDVPYVKRLELEYRFPAYTGLEPQTIEDGGDIAVLRGTEVRVRVVPTMRTAGGRLVLDGQAPVPLEPADHGTLATRFTVDRDGSYRVELAASSGKPVAASPHYTIDALSDEAPTVSLSRPGRDTTASPVEEFFVETRAQDDFGVRGLELVYSVNGGNERTIPLFEGRTRLADVTAGHTFYLEEMQVQPGDSLSYHARATDNDPRQGAKRATSDIYFLRIRPFEKQFRKATSEASAGQGGAGELVDALSQRQKQVIAATFNVQRDRPVLAPGKLRESAVIVALAQARLREEVERMLTRMHSELVRPDPGLKKIADLLPKAVVEMTAAEARLQAVAPDAALPPEQRALGWLQKVEEEYDLQVASSRNGGGGGAGSVADELSDLFDRDFDRLGNQYETMERASRQNADQRLDELVEKLKELARRQEQEAERQRRRAPGTPSPGFAAAQQQALAEEAEQAARRLDRLSREESRPELADSARRLRDAADAMRRAAADRAGAGQGAAALDRLRQAQRELQRAQSARTGRDLDDAVRQADQLARDQRDIAGQVRALEGAGDRRRDQARQIAGRKSALDAKVGELEQQLDRTAAAAGGERRGASARVSEAAKAIRDKRVRDKIRYSRALLGRPEASDVVQQLEADIGESLDAVRKQLAAAASALSREQPDRMDDALERAGRLARRAESFEQRLRERAGGSEQAQSGDNAQSSDPRATRGRQGQPQAPQGGDAPGEGDSKASAAGSIRDGAGRSVGRDGSSYGDGSAYGYRGDWRGRLSPDDIRQFRGEVRQWSREAEALRRLIREEKIDPQELDTVLRELRALDDERVYQDVGELARLQSFVTEGLRRVEYGLRRRADGAGREVAMSAADEVPESFRGLIAQYYRALAALPR